jgi:hypothetical protein
MAKKLKQLTELKKNDIVPTPGNDKGQNVSYKNVVQGGEKAFVDKHVVQKTDYPVPEKNAGDKNAIFSGAKQTKKKRLADQENEAGDKMYEAKDAIMASLKAIKSDFVKSHGHDPIQSDVDVEEEEVWIDEYELKDGSLIEIDEETMSILDEVYESLSEDHQDQFDVLFSENRETNTNLLEWVRSVQ